MLVSASEGGEIIASKHVAAMHKIVRMDYRTVHVLVLQQFSHFTIKHAINSIKASDRQLPLCQRILVPSLCEPNSL
jgi:hypothetical protein